MTPSTSPDTARGDVTVTTPSGAYAVEVGADTLATLGHRLDALGLAEPWFLITDTRLAELHAPTLAKAWSDEGRAFHMHALPEGEVAKSLESVTALWDFLLSKGAERASAVIAFGGGTVGDAAGFAAATYFRGVPLVHVPTTLLAQVDSSIGGKTAINHPRSKNAIGAFYQPRLVFSDVRVLDTLETRDLHSGLAEVVKVALLFDREFCEWLVDRWDAILAGDVSVRVETVVRAAELKARVVAADVDESKGSRHLLNFGHTLAHGFEAATGYGYYRHGEAVALGLRGAVALSRRLGGLSHPSDRELADTLLERIVAPAPPPAMGVADVTAAFAHDKKNVGGRSRFVVLDRVGAGRLTAEIEPQVVHDVVSKLLSRPSGASGDE